MQQVKLTHSRRGRAAAYPVFVIVIALLFAIPASAVPLPDIFGARPYAQSEMVRTIPNTDVNPYGGNFFLHEEVESWKIDKTLQMASEAGLGWVKQQFPWESLEKSPGRFWDDRYNVSTWDKYDFIVNTAAKYGLQVIARLDRPPDWAREANTTPWSPPKDFASYGQFVYEVAKHFKGRVRYYQIWNEPNLTEEWGNKPVDAKAYVEMLKVAYQEIKRADPDAYVLSAPLAQTVEQNQSHLSDVTFLEQMYAAGAKDYFDILFANAYGFSAPPEDPPSPDVLNFSRVLLLRRVMESNGDAAKPVWFNEFGWNASPPDMPADSLMWGRVSEQQQAEFTVRAVEMARHDWPWAGVFNIWFFRQPGHIGPDDSQFYFRMVDIGFTPRLVYRSVKEATAPLRTAGPGHYQETNPALAAQGSWQFVSDAQAEAKGVIASARPDDTLAISFSGGSISLIAETGPDCGRLYLSLDDNGVDGAKVDRNGRPYVDFYSETPASQVTIPIAGGLRPGGHKLTLTVAAEHEAAATGDRVAIDGFVVGPASPFPWLEASAGFVAAATVLGFVVWRRRRTFPAARGGGNA